MPCYKLFLDLFTYAKFLHDLFFFDFLLTVDFFDLFFDFFFWTFFLLFNLIFLTLTFGIDFFLDFFLTFLTF